jgi:hypothetical protein
MRKATLRAFIGMGALSLASTLWGCVADRPSRNGVFNENIYIRKSFLVRGAEGDAAKDTGWFFKATILAASTPNPLAPIFMFPGAHSEGKYVRFVVTQDKLQMVNMREHSADTPVNPQDPSKGGLIENQGTRTPEVLNAWNASSVDIKYRVNLDGEKTNFLEENQELNWQVRQWVKVNVGKSDLSDFAPYGTSAQQIIDQCADGARVSTTLVPDSFYVDEERDYMQWKVRLTIPLRMTDPACVEAYGEQGYQFSRFGREAVTVDMLYSFARAHEWNPQDPAAYKPLELEEKDPIRRKYGIMNYTARSRDLNTQLLSARQYVMRFNPEKPIVFYFAKGYPEQHKKFFCGNGWTTGQPCSLPGGIVAQTNEIFEKSGVKARVVLKNYDEDLQPGERPREFGDVRYNFARWISDYDSGSPFIGVMQPHVDPRNGEMLTSTIEIQDFAIKDLYIQRIDSYLQTIGASYGLNSTDAWPNPRDPRDPTKTLDSCTDGEIAPLVPSEYVQTHNRSSLYQKMQEYLGKPAGSYGNLSPTQFVAKQDAEFINAYYGVIPYMVYADPDANEFVIPEGGAGVFGPGEALKDYGREAAFHETARKIDRGEVPFDVHAGKEMILSAAKFLNTFRDNNNAQREAKYRREMRNVKRGFYFETFNDGTIEKAFERAGRHCRNGKWETKEEWVEGIIDSVRAGTVWHEFGHAIGLEHNFMASVDQPHWPTYKAKVWRTNPNDGKYEQVDGEVVGMYASSIMEYNIAADRAYWSGGATHNAQGWGPYDKGAIAFAYANQQSDYKKLEPGTVVAHHTGQKDATAPWKDPYGFRADGKEMAFLFCTHNHIKYTPLCRQHDFGATPSQIIASDIEMSEWQYRWRNYRIYRKIWNNATYADQPANFEYQLKRFLPMWGFDWDNSDLIESFRRLGINPPADAPSILYWYAQLTDKFDKEMSAANSMMAVYHKAVIQQASGERPYRTVYDRYHGDVTQQGIVLDKLFALQGFVGLYPGNNYDPNQAGSYLTAYGSFGDQDYIDEAEDVVASMIGEQYYDAYPYFKPLGVVQFTMDTHSNNYFGRRDIRDWAGGYVFRRQVDMLHFFRELATKHHTHGCTKIETCNYDPTEPRLDPRQQDQSDTFHEFVGPDGRRWVWVYIQDRNTWIFADRDRNVATYRTINDYILRVIKLEEDTDAAYNLQQPLKYFLDAFETYN